MTNEYKMRWIHICRCNFCKWLEKDRFRNMSYQCWVSKKGKSNHIRRIISEYRKLSNK